jgi:hypothetical protein
VASIEEIAYREATRSITQQQSVLDNIRGRAGLLFSAASVATAFLGGEALGGDGVPVLGWLGIVLYLLILLATVAVLWPYTFNFRFEATTILEGYADRSVEEAYRYLAGYLDGQYMTNQGTIDCLLTALQAASVLLGLEVVCWLAVLGTS